MTAHRATLEEAYMELTRESVEYRAAGSGRSGGSLRGGETGDAESTINRPGDPGDHE